MSQPDYENIKDAIAEDEKDDEGDGYDAMADAAAQAVDEIPKLKKLPGGVLNEQENNAVNKPPGDCLPSIENLLRQRFVPTEGNVEFSKIGQEKVSLKNGFEYTQNNDGSMVVKDTTGNTFIVAADNTLTVVRPGGQVETYKPQISQYKDGGSIGYGYPEEAGFHMVRKARGFGRERDTGVEIQAGSSSLTTVSQPGRPATYSYADIGKRIRSEKTAGYRPN